MKLKKIAFFKVILLVSILIFEGGLRILTPFPVHGPKANRIRDAKLNHRMDPDFEGIDESGFRNPTVPTKAEIVALGDSHTYGYNVASEQSWPYQLGSMTGMSVYNFGIGGYGMVQYYYLMDEALKLRPRHVILGLYPANDVNDISSMYDRLPRELIGFMEEAGKDVNVVRSDKKGAEESRFKARLKSLVKSTATGSMLVYYSKNSPWLRAGKDKDIPAVKIKEANNRTIIKYDRISSHKSHMELETDRGKALMELTRRILARMKKKADKNGALFSVLIIPSREYVFYDYLVEKGYDLPDSYDDLARNEEKITSELIEFLDEAGIKHASAYPGLVSLIKTTGGVYPDTDNGHPLLSGYKVYADTALEGLLKN